ncbi:hypothetical protein GCM10022232_88600 [Streptomyces plumbiresistens]|uniref:Uncharacterized protein n=1 Tax=Streptomyces plumbiresistens TaxID=511811 RepID=A0ABP7TPL2_9ACTN
MHSRVEAMVMAAFDTAQGMVMANSGTAKLERIPTPPPKITNRRKEAMGPGEAEVAVSGFGARGDFMAASFRRERVLFRGCGR